jgi:transcriptional regulator with XRE-family HTH domain
VATDKQQARRRIYVREWRLFRGKTQTDLASACGLTHGAISLLENGHNSYTQSSLECIADALDCEPGDLITRQPTDEDACELWILWNSATESQRDQLTRIARVIIPRAAEPLEPQLIRRAETTRA